MNVSSMVGRRVLIIFPVLALIAVIQAPAYCASQAQVSAYFNIQPGTSTKAEVDLNLGEPRRKLEDLVYEYDPPREVKDTARVVATFFSDSKQVARLDVYLKSPIAPEVLRQQFGTRVMQRDRVGGGQEEVFYPKLHALVFASKAGDALVSAISYLSPRLMADFYAERFNDYLRDKRYDDAQTEADKAVLLDPDYARGYVAQGLYYQSQSDFEEAIVRYIAGTNAKYSARARSSAHALLGTLYWNKKNLSEKAQVEFQRAISVSPDLDEARFLYGTFLEAQKKRDEAAGEFSKAVELNPRNMQAQMALAQSFYQREDYSKALPHYEALSRWVESENPSDLKDSAKATIHFNYAYCLSKQGKSELAIQSYSKAILKDWGNVLAYNNMGREYQALGNFEKALESFRNGLKVEPKHPLLNQNLGIALLESGRAEEARRQMELALTLSPTNSTAMFDMARCWGAMGKKKQTLQYLQQAVSSGFKDRAKLTSDHYLALVQKDGDFKKMLLQVQ